MGRIGLGGKDDAGANVILWLAQPSGFAPKLRLAFNFRILADSIDGFVGGMVLYLAGEVMPPRHPLPAVFASMCLGILWDLHVQAFYALECCVAVAGLLGWSVFWARGYACLAGLMLLSSVAASSAAWHRSCWSFFRSDEVGRFARETAQPVCLQGISLTSPVRRPKPPFDPMCTMPQEERSLLLVEVHRLRDGGRWRRVSGHVGVTVEGLLPGVTAGDRLQVYGSIATPGGPRNPGEADFAAMERRQRRLCRVFVHDAACVKRLPADSLSGVRIWLNRVRARGDASLWRHISPARAGLAAAILLGLREELDAARRDDFFRTGTMHLLAISGQHVVILVYGLGLLLRLGWLPRRSALAATSAFVVLYALLTDARPPVVRAAVLIVVMCLARWLGRRCDSLHLLCVAAIVVLVINPTSLFDTGAQLSFLAVASLIVAGQILQARASKGSVDPIARLIERSRSGWVRLGRRLAWRAAHLFVLTAVVWMATLPLVLHRFHLVSFAGLFVNPVVGLPMAAALFSGFGVFALADFSPPLASLCGWVCDGSLAAMEWCLRTSLALPAAYVWVPSVPPWWVTGYYLVMTLWVGTGHLRFVRAAAAFSVVWIGLGFGLAYGFWSDGSSDRLECTFASVGHGTSVLVELPTGEKYLYDAGHQGAPAPAVFSISSLLWHRGVWRLDAIILSHADTDHYNAVPQLLDRFRVDRVIVSPGLFDEGGAALGALRQAIQSARVPVVTAAASPPSAARITSGLTVLHPDRRVGRESDNSASLVLSVAFGDHMLLLPGDVESPGLDRLVASQSVDADVAMAPHHGSHRSLPAAFAAWATPEWVVISGARWRDTTESERTFADCGARVFHTADAGAVRVVFEKGAVRLQGWRREPW